MQIISHRGCWRGAEEKNILTAFSRSFALGFGTETDLRDQGGRLVISHNPALGNALTAEEFFSEYVRHEESLPLALNIKADGLQQLLEEMLATYKVSNYFVFDMSVPDTILYLKSGFRVFARQSEYEPTPALYDQIAGVWIDHFQSDAWINSDIVENHIAKGKQVCLVSPELHGRAHEFFWNRLAEMPVATSSEVMLCTDYPEEAKSFFV